ncbi:MAG: hypothetical protein AAGC74_05550 [Verrucomicrobiota bacterium]
MRAIVLVFVLAMSLGGAKGEEEAKMVFGIEEFGLVAAEEGRTTYHVDKWRPVFSINAGNKATHGKWARAEVKFEGEAGVYEVKLTTITEFDGESEYRLLVDGKVVAEFKNPRVDKKGDMKPHEHVWRKIELGKGSRLAVESMVASNGLIPEGDGFAFARGRWKAVEVLVPEKN